MTIYASALAIAIMIGRLLRSVDWGSCGVCAPRAGSEATSATNVTLDDVYYSCHEKIFRQRAEVKNEAVLELEKYNSEITEQALKP